MAILERDKGKLTGFHFMRWPEGKVSVAVHVESLSGNDESYWAEHFETMPKAIQYVTDVVMPNLIPE